MMKRQFLLLCLLYFCLFIVSSEGKEQRDRNGPDLSISEELFVRQLDKAANSVDQSTYRFCSNGEWTNPNEQDNSCICVSCHSVYEVCGTTLMYISSALNLSLNLRINNDSNGTDSNESTTAEAYGYGTIMIVFISLLSLLGLFIVPCLTRTNPTGQLISRYLLTLLTAMGVSALMCGVMFELIPTIFRIGHSHGESHDHDHDHDHNHDHDHDDDELSESEIVWKGTAIVGGVLIFYVLESILQTLVDNTKKKNDKSKLTAEEQKAKDDQSPLMDGEIEVVADTNQTFVKRFVPLNRFVL
ncbi:PREDICTED: histidine-rich membrane protein KE4 homolog 2-like [Amphimedon queenslandica]|uniref:Uncharacterized protein n=1 Tax=Amphimedon queenslandica TaxID=400682 RepID=A0AAN0IYZ2_AMPQE|nr:PREDICTED: histidine-rich membrane protein KE4 homolog 2-like [Amphimedon queenslandica]|eukprot:XP_019849668.1 PREDICTED: histidine-rich membrane protein KE4 homolog 2-like [Amphimedon queenslandica]